MERFIVWVELEYRSKQIGKFRREDDAVRQASALLTQVPRRRFVIRVGRKPEIVKEILR